MAPEDPVSDEELERRLRDDEVDDSELGELPTMGDDETEQPGVVFQDEDPEKFSQLIKEAGGEPAVAQEGGDSDDPLLRIEQLIKGLPDAIASVLGVTE